ncbi:YggS family pyridoxal phosphate-dependent enzyme [Aliidiomarina sanyensis]|uniref:Pyridoxal phosphate homeostasis protein n=1 Tax=Aliidiomarina sanyensis TaxID=1249555 RepID=A0A432WBP0_9GAMM|nr:YggS family pyridoxal phosphate-dependent enzyme [Aliidiomarina sanyensis]RUO29466.1 YggS family pyridoxal phosphate-dependent enzyme [Aliidiomarina sanyensis]
MTTDRGSIDYRLQAVRQQIINAAQQVNRDPKDITLLAVSKTKPMTMIREAYLSGQRSFGENYVQEGVQKINEATDLGDIEWHFIGPIQSNKTKDIAQHFHWVHSIDREKIARRLDEQRPRESGPLNVLIQINIDDEQSKAGIALSELKALATFISKCSNLRLRGIMAIPAADASESQQKSSFAALYKAFQELKTTHPNVDTLSMGMSNDLDAAIAHGSTLVRVGTAIFGARTEQN